MRDEGPVVVEVDGSPAGQAALAFAFAAADAAGAKLVAVHAWGDSAVDPQAVQKDSPRADLISACIGGTRRPLEAPEEGGSGGSREYHEVVADVEKRKDRAPVPSAFEYATASESREIVRRTHRIWPGRDDPFRRSARPTPLSTTCRRSGRHRKNSRGART